MNLTDQLCRQAVALRRELAADAETRSDPGGDRSLVVTRTLKHGQLHAIRFALGCIHGWRDTSTTGPAEDFILQWWEEHCPSDWPDGAAHPRWRMHYELNDMLLCSEHRHPHALGRHIGQPMSSSHRAFALPYRNQWATLLPYIEALGADPERYLKLWAAAQG